MTTCSLFSEHTERHKNFIVKTNLSELEQEVVGLFVRIAGVLNLPRSVGELYGLLYISPDPLSIDDCMRKLKISKGSTSQGLKILRSFGAVRVVYVAGQRRDFYTAEAGMRRIVTGFVNEQIRPSLVNGKERIARLEELAADEENDFFSERIDRLKGWQKRAAALLPFALNFIKPE